MTTGRFSLIWFDSFRISLYSYRIIHLSDYYAKINAVLHAHDAAQNDRMTPQTENQSHNDRTYRIGHDDYTVLIVLVGMREPRKQMCVARTMAILIQALT
jgi:hypothetical protein